MVGSENACLTAYSIIASSAPIKNAVLGTKRNSRIASRYRCDRWQAVIEIVDEDDELIDFASSSSFRNSSGTRESLPECVWPQRQASGRCGFGQLRFNLFRAFAQSAGDEPMLPNARFNLIR